MISTNEFKTNVTVTIDGDAWQVVEFQHVKPGKGAAFVRAKMRNLCTGAVVERTFNAGERLPKAHIDRREMQYLYESDGMYVFMDNETYEQTELSKETLGSALNFLKENMDVKIMIYDNRVLGVDLPNTVELTVVETEPGIKGDTATGGSKNATMDTGYVVKVPLFINEGEKMSPADQSVGKQLPYVPEHSASLTGRLSWRSWAFLYKWAYYSERFTMSSNDYTLTGHLPEYFMSNISLEKGLSFKPLDLQLKFAVNNLFNEDYLSVLSRPMPGINFELFIGITPKFDKNKKKQ